MKTALAILAFLFIVATAAHAQVAPEATAGTAELHYSVRYAQNAEFFSGSEGDSQNSIISGNLTYTNGVKHLPFALTYGGGYGWNIAGTPYGDGLFLNLLLAQGIVGRKWSILASDNVSYRRMAPVSGFSGVAGTGEPVGGSGSSSSSSETVLTLNTRTVNNTVGVQFQHVLNYATTLSIGGSSELLRYPDGNGLDTNSQMANGMLTRRLNARNSLSGQYEFSDYSYPDSTQSQGMSNLITHSVLFGYQRAWSRQVTTDASIGPQWVESSSTSLVPSSTRVSGNARVNDQFRFGSAALTYSHAASGGGGFLYGAEVDSVSADLSREIKRRLTVGLTGGYRRTSSLGNQGEINGKFGAALASLRLSPHFTAFVNYTAMDQSTSYSLPANALTNLQQVVSFGIGYSPREKRLETQ